MNSKIVSEIFKILFQTGDINIFVLSFIKNPISKSYFKLEVLIFLSFLLLKENSIIGRSWSSANMFIMQNYIDNAIRNVPLTVDNV